MKYNRKTLDALKEMADTFRTWEQLYDMLIKDGIELDDFAFRLDKDNVWKRTVLMWMFDYFIKNKDYTKCDILYDIMKEHYIAPEDKQKDLNEKIDKINELNEINKKDER